jgi:hypothetical protein
MRNYLRDHRLLTASAVLETNNDSTYRYRIPGAYEYSIERLICPKVPDIVEAEGCLRDTDTAPGSQHKDEERILRVSRRTIC